MCGMKKYLIALQINIGNKKKVHQEASAQCRPVSFSLIHFYKCTDLIIFR